jgi:hypothetical protein
MDASELRRKAVIYLTMVMRFAVRALSVFLTVWLTAAGAFPPCCWSMASADAHQQAPDTASSDATPSAHHRDHHGSGDADSGTYTESLLSALPASDCDAELADATTTAGVAKRVALRPALAKSDASIPPPTSEHDVVRSDTSPPGSSLTPAFLSPLRI